MTGRANPLVKPEPHACCASSSHLRVRSYRGAWSWVLQVGGIVLPVMHCCWCGVYLPRTGKSRLRVVKS